MNLFELFVKIGVKDEASDKISKITGKLGNGIKSAAEIGIKSVAVASTAIAGLAGVAIKNFAEYEQLVGGAELMFGEAFNTVMRNSQEAYRTVQMSQNEYLQQVNGFATGLKTSLDGNEQAAAELAHRIIQAEADIVAATGNTQENVANAFNGIMKSNFTMLDNLQIGITPTKEGFQEVIDKVNEWNTTNGKATEYQMGNLADMQSALVDYIEMVGMSGYAQNEAAETIQGSLAMTKSALSNLLTSMADESADLNGLIDDFVESVGIAAENVIPRVEVALEGAINVVDKLLPLALEKIPTIVVQLGPKIVSSGVSALRSLVSGIIDNKDELIDAASEMVLTLVDGLADMAPDVIDGAIELFNGIVDAIPVVAIKVLREMPRIIKAIVEGLAKGAGAVFEAIGDLLDPTTWRLAEAREEIEKMADSVTPFQKTLDTATANLSHISELLSTEGRTIGEIDDQIATVENQINTILEAAYQRRDGLRAKEIESIKKYNAEIAALEKEKLEIYRNAFIVETQKIILEGDQLTEEQAAQFYLNAQGLLDDANQSVQDAYNAELTRILNLEQAAKANGTFVESEFSKLRSQARAERDNALKENEQFYVDAMEAVTGFSQQVTGVSFENVFALQGELDRFTKEYTKNIDAHAGVINDLQKTFLGALFSPVDELIDNIWGYGAAADESLEKVLASYKKIDIEAYNTYLSMIANATSSGAEIGAENEAIVDSFLSMFEGVPKEVEKDAKKVLLGIISGMEKQIPGLENASNMSLEAIVGTLREGLNAQKGKELAGNLVSGMTTTLNNSTSIFSKLGSTIGSIFSSAFSNSSKVTVPRNYVSVDLDGSHAGGLDYVPFDGYVAELHKGERVLTADQARGYGSSTYNISIEVNGANYPNPDKLATTIAQKIQKMTDRRSAARA